MCIHIEEGVYLGLVRVLITYIWVTGGLLILKNKTVFLIYEEFSAPINKKNGKQWGKYVNSSYEVFQRYSASEVPHCHTAQFLLSSVTTSGEVWGKALVGRWGFQQFKAESGEKRTKATFTCHWITAFSPLKVVIFSTRFYGAHACLCDFSFQREVFCF